MKYCSDCGQQTETRIPAGDTLPRFVCTGCGRIHYQNPNMVVGCIPEWEDGRILLCRRAIEPRSGFWTVPAGFLENDETLQEGAAREAREEALARIEVGALVAVIDVPHARQVHIMFRGRLLDEDFGVGEESSDVGLFAEQEIPWDEIAFPSVARPMRYFFEDRKSGDWQVRHDVIRLPRPPSRTD